MSEGGAVLDHQYSSSSYQFRHVYSHVAGHLEDRGFRIVDPYVLANGFDVTLLRGVDLVDHYRVGAAQVDFARTSRGPLLLVAGGADHIVPASVVRRTYARYRRAASAVTELREFAGRTHWIIAEPGWDEVAGAIEQWLADKGLGPQGAVG